MKKLSKIKLVLCFVLIMAQALPLLAVAQSFTANSVFDVQPSEKVKADDMDAILEKLNTGNTGRPITSLPMTPNVDIPDDFEPDDTPHEYFNPDELTEEEIEVVIQRIANGENVLFGVAEDYEEVVLDEDGNPTRWSATSGKPCHQWITTRAFTILKKGKSASYNWFTSSERATVVSYSDWPDNNEKTNIHSWHFYHYPTGTNYWWNSFDTKNASNRFIYWYNMAVTQTRQGNRNVGLQHLGKAIHYLSDIGAPPHVGDRATLGPGNTLSESLVLAANHLTYETTAYNRRELYAVSSTDCYNWYVNKTLSYISQINAGISYNFYGNCYVLLFPSLRDPTIEWPLKYVQQDIAGLLYKFHYDVTK